MKKKSGLGRWGRWGWDRVVSLLLMVVIFAVCTVIGAVGVKRPEGLGITDEPKIKELIYPTFGNPAIVKSGGDVTVEFDPRRHAFAEPFVDIHDFELSVMTTNDPNPVKMDLPVESTVKAESTRWPEFAAMKGDKRVYHVRATVPLALPRDLYDLKVTAKLTDGEVMTDSQPHALQTVESFKEDFTFCQLTDIHVWGPEMYYPSCTYHERSGRPNGIDTDRLGAVYYKKAINQINTIKPDFCVFSGDYMFGQSYFVRDQGQPWGVTTEYQYEMQWFYQETLKLEVPVFISIGNHDGYYEGDKGAGEDWFENFRLLFGPVYHSFDYGNCHFLSLNSMDWEASDRTLSDWFGIILQPKKYKGQLRGGGDEMEPGVTETRLNAIDENRFRGQLAWARDDLRASQGAAIRVVVMHHDPWKIVGSGEMWGAEPEHMNFQKFFKQAASNVLDMGNGQGRLAVIALMKRYRVGLEISGHDHTDYVGSTSWSDQKGTLHFVNTTSTQFQSEKEEQKYPGYRRITISKGAVTGFNYKEPKWSYPFYRGTRPGETTDLGDLSRPAIETMMTGADVASGGRTVTQEATVSVDNSLNKPLQNAYAEFRMRPLSGGYYYLVQNGRFGDVFDDAESSPKQRTCQVYTDVPAASVKTVRVRKSDAPDRKPPRGTATVTGVGKEDGRITVRLALKASDPGGSGVKDVMISTASDFKGASWVPYRKNLEFALDGAAVGRHIYVRFRDMAMPANVSQTAAVTVR